MHMGLYMMKIMSQQEAIESILLSETHQSLPGTSMYFLD